MLQGLFTMVVLPSLLGMLLNQLTAGKVKETVGTRIAPFSKMGLAVVIAINGAVVAPYFTQIDGRFVWTASVIVMIVHFRQLERWI